MMNKEDKMFLKILALLGKVLVYTAIAYLLIASILIFVSYLVDENSDDNTTSNQYIFEEGLTPVEFIHYQNGKQLWLCEDSNSRYITCTPEIVAVEEGD